MREPVVAGPAIAETEGDPWVQGTEKSLQNAAVEDPAHEAVAERHIRAQAVAMAETEYAPADFNDIRLNQTLHSQFLKI